MSQDLARQRKRILKALSIIVPNWNSPIIHKVLEALKSQTVDLSHAEILVVGVDAPGLVTEDRLVRFISTHQSANPSVNRNVALEQAQGDILFFTDHDCLVAPDWIERHLERHRQGEQVVGGAVAFGVENILQLADNVSAFHDLLPFTAEGPRLYLVAANLSIDRSVFAAAGELRADLARANDLEWTARFRSLGYRLYFDPRAVVYHDPPRRTVKSVWRHWTDDAPDTLLVRLQHAHLLDTPRLAHYRGMFLWGSPFVAAWATARTFSHPEMRRRYGYTLPLVYLTKLAWCWSAFANYPVEQRQRGLL